MKRISKKVTWLFFSAALLAACAQIPAESISINTAVSKGIEGMQANMETLIEERAATQLKAYDEAYNGLFEEVRTAFANKIATQKNVAPADYNLTPVEEAQLTAFFITDIDQKIRAEVNRQKNEALSQTRKDVAFLLSLNNSITALLQSANEVGVQRAATVENIASITKFEEISKIEDFINTTLTSAITTIPAS